MKTLEDIKELFPSKYWRKLTSKTNDDYVLDKMMGIESIWITNDEFRIWQNSKYMIVSLKQAKAYYKKHFTLTNFE